MEIHKYIKSFIQALLEEFFETDPNEINQTIKQVIMLV